MQVELLQLSLHTSTVDKEGLDYLYLFDLKMCSTRRSSLTSRLYFWLFTSALLALSICGRLLLQEELFQPVDLFLGIDVFNCTSVPGQPAKVCFSALVGSEEEVWEHVACNGFDVKPTTATCSGWVTISTTNTVPLHYALHDPSVGSIDATDDDNEIRCTSAKKDGSLAYADGLEKQ